MDDAPAALTLSASFSETSASIFSVSLPSQAYVLSLASIPSFYAASASAPSNQIHLFEKSSLQGAAVFPGHEVGTTSLQCVPTVANISRPSLVSTGLDGSVKVWDERTSSHSIKMTNLGQSRGLLCCDVSQDGMTVAAGTQLQGEDAHLLYWDPRQPAAPLRTHSSTHSDDVTVLQFSPDSPGVLLSASTDGLICTSDPNEEDEDEAGIHVGSWNTSVSQAGWIQSPGSAKIWGASDMETFSTWSHELDLLQNQDIRGPSLHNHPQHEWLTDYMIKCHSTADADFKVFVGSNQGDFALLTNPDLASPGAPWTLQKTWSHGHTGIVRSLLWDEQSGVVLSGGEDSAIKMWRIEGSEQDTSMDVDSVPWSKTKRRGMDWEDEQQGKRARR